MVETIVPCPICQQSCRLYEINTYKVEKNKRFYYMLMKMFKKSLFALMQNVENPINWKEFIITKCSNVIIEVFYILHKVVNLSIMLKM